MKLAELKNYDSSFSIISGREDLEVSGICDKRSFSQSSLYFCKNKKFLEVALAESERNFGLVFEKEVLDGVNQDDFLFCAVVDNIPLAMSHLSKPFFDEKMKGLNDEVDGRQMGTTEVHPSAIVSQNVFLGANVKVGKGTRLHPGVVIMSNCEIGEDCEIFPSTVLHPFSKLGNNVRISSNCTIGSDGFGYNFDKGVHHKVWHSGGVIIEDNVEFGSGVTVDQGTFSATVIGAGSKADNQVHIAHNVIVGKGAILCGQVGLAGSCTLGDYCVLGGKAGIGPDCEVGPGCQIAGNAMVTTSWPAGSTLGGHPARPLKEWMKGVAYIRKNSLKK